MLNLANYQTNANQNYKEVPLHTDQSGHHQKVYEEQGFLGGAVVKNLPANAGDTGSSPGPGRSHTPQNN